MFKYTGLPRLFIATIDQQAVWYDKRFPVQINGFVCW